MNMPTDPWAEWILRGRFESVQSREAARQSELFPIRDQMLDLANITSDDTVLDIGCGDGLLALGALERLGPQGRAIFSDISPALLEYCKLQVEQIHKLEQCEFIQASAEDLSRVPSASVNVVTIRSVLIYVKDKQKVFDEIFRVLKAYGRIVLFEPIHHFKPLEQFGDPPRSELFYGYDARPILSLVKKVQTLFEQLQPFESSPMYDFDERDMIYFAHKSGFASISLFLQANYVPMQQPLSWQQFLQMQSNPLVPTINDALKQTLTVSEIKQFEAHFRPLVEAGQGHYRLTTLFLQAGKHS